MNMKDAFRFQNKLKGLMCEATAILQDRRNIVKVKTTHLRSKVMSDAQDAVVEETAPSEYAGHANQVPFFYWHLEIMQSKILRIKQSMPVASTICFLKTSMRLGTNDTSSY